MNKVLVSLVVPALNEKYEVLVPDFLMIREIVPLLAEALTDLTDHRYVSSGSELLCWPEKEIVFNQKKTLTEYGVQNGDELYLF